MSILIKGINIEDLQLPQLRAMVMFSGYEIVELPDHGDLIDRDAVIAESRSGDYWWETEHEVPKILNEIPTVIPAERSDDE